MLMRAADFVLRVAQSWTSEQKYFCTVSSTFTETPPEFYTRLLSVLLLHIHYWLFMCLFS